MVECLAGAALGGLGPAGAQPGGSQLLPRLGKAFLELADLRLKAVFHRCGLGGGGGRLSRGPFGILVFLPGTGGALGCLPRPPLRLRFRRQPLLFRLVRHSPLLPRHSLRGRLSGRTRGSRVSG